MLAPSTARLEHAHALLALGSETAAGSDEDRQDLLRSAMDAGHRCGSPRVVERALQLLRASGARPRRPVSHGVEALTGQERRVSRLAAEGRGNREIAEAMFLTRRTAELHLTNAYRKLGIRSRGELRGALDPG